MGSPSASARVLLAAIRERAWIASSTLLLPAAFGPNSTVKRGRSMATFRRDLNPRTARCWSTTLPWHGEEHRVQETLLLAVLGIEGGQGVREPQEVRAPADLRLQQVPQRAGGAARLEEHGGVDPVQRRRVPSRLHRLLGGSG